MSRDSSRPGAGVCRRLVSGLPGKHLETVIHTGMGALDTVLHRYDAVLLVNAANALFQHPVRDPADTSGWIGVDRGLAAFVAAATADGHEVARITGAPKALAAAMPQLRRRAKKLSRRQNGSRNLACCRAFAAIRAPTCVPERPRSAGKEPR
jgi:hypothetical protein